MRLNCHRNSKSKPSKCAMFSDPFVDMVNASVQCPISTWPFSQLDEQVFLSFSCTPFSAHEKLFSHENWKTCSRLAGETQYACAPTLSFIHSPSPLIHSKFSQAPVDFLIKKYFQSPARPTAGKLASSASDCQAVRKRSWIFKSFSSHRRLSSCP